MYNSNTHFSLQMNDIKAILQAQQLLNNVSMLASQLSSANMMSPFINQASMPQNMYFNGLPATMNTIGQTNHGGSPQANIFQTQMPPWSMGQNIYTPSAVTSGLDTKKVPFNEESWNTLGSINYASPTSNVNSLLQQDDAILTKPRSYTTCSSELPTESSEKNKIGTPCSKDSICEDVILTGANDKSDSPKINSSNVSNQENGIVFNIRRFNKKTNKFVLLTRHRKIITKCSHTDGEYYAKGMCKKCYHNKGERSRFATKCGHSDKYHYARGLCKGCYLFEYHNKRKDKSS